MINNGNLNEALTMAYREAALEEHPDYQSFHRSVDRRMYEFAKQVHEHDANRSNLLQALQWHALVNVDDNQEYRVQVNELDAFSTEMKLDAKKLLLLSSGTVEEYKAPNGDIWKRANRVESVFYGQPYRPRKPQDSPEFIIRRQRELKEQRERQALLDANKYVSPKPMKPVKTYTSSFH
jgi:hypothetical protein